MAFTASDYGIDRDRILYRDAADFYTLYLIANFNEDAATKQEARDRLTTLVDELAATFEMYLFAAMGGEVRHFGHNDKESVTTCECPDHDAHGECDYSPDCSNQTNFCHHCTECGTINIVELPKPGIPFPAVLKPIFGNNPSIDGPGSRVGTWTAFCDYVLKSDDRASLAKGLQEAFETSEAWAPGYGGPGWANAAHTLLRYLKGDLGQGWNARFVFVDQCWSLEHNNGCIFDKMFAIDYVRTALEHQAMDHHDELAQITSPAVNTLYLEYRGAETRIAAEKEEARKQRQADAIRVMDEQWYETGGDSLYAALVAQDSPTAQFL